MTDKERIAQVDSSEYKKLLDFIVDKALDGDEFTTSDVSDFFPGENDTQISKRLASLCHSRIHNVEHFQVKPETFLAYLEFLSLKESQATAHKADSRAMIAICIAVAGLIVNIVSNAASPVPALIESSMAKTHGEMGNIQKQLSTLGTALQSGISKTESIRSELTKHLSSRHHLDDVRAQRIIDALVESNRTDQKRWDEVQRQLSEVSGPTKIELTQWNELKELLRQLIAKKPAAIPVTPEQTTTE